MKIPTAPRLSLASCLLLATVVGTTACAPSNAPAPSTAPAATASVKTAPSSPATSGTGAVSASPGASGASIAGPFAGEAKTLNGAGATFPAVLYSKWFNEYEKVTGVKVNYQSIGSGGGIKGVQDQTVDFGGSDSAMTDEQLRGAKGGELFHIPAALGAVVPTYNLPNVSESLKFTPDTLAGIYLGEIKKWNDPKLVADNPSLGNVNQEIVVVHRSDGSGTTSIWVDYLSTVSKSWETKAGRGTSVNWPVGLGGRGNEGVAGEVKQNQYSIGYVELIYAVQNKLGVGLVKNKSGKFVEASLDSVTAAAASVAQTINPDLRASIVDAPSENAYPISGFTWLLAYKNVNDRAKGLALTRMLWWATHEAQKFNSELGYAPIPAEITAKSDGMIRAISVEGQPVFPGR